MPTKLHAVFLGLSLAALDLAGCGPMPVTPGDVVGTDAADVRAPPGDTGGGDARANEFASAPTCTVNGFARLQGAVYMAAPIPASVIAEGRPALVQTAAASTLSLADASGAGYLLRFEWTGTLAADQSADLTGAQVFFPMDQGPSAPPLDPPWAGRRVCAGAGSRIMMRASGMQFILRNWTITTGACPGGETGQDEIQGCYVPNVAP